MAEIGLIESIGVMIVSAAVVVLLTRRLNVPTIVLYILTGLVLGPVLGVLAVDTGTADEEMTDGALGVVSEIGIALLLFLVGLELSYEKIKDVGKVTVLAGLAQVVLTGVFGFVLCLLLGFSLIESMFIATALTNSSTVLVVKLLEKKKQTNSVFGHIAIGMNLAKDLALVAVLTIVVAVGAPEEFDPATEIGRLLGMMAGIVVAGIVVIAAARFALPAVMDWASRSHETLLIWALFWCFTLVVFAEWIGLSSAIGAFVAGVSLAQIRTSSVLQQQLHPLMNFFLAVFFIAVGAQMQVEAAAGYWRASLAITAFVIIVNPIICMWLVTRFGYGERTSFLASVPMAQISELSFVFAAVGLSVGMIGDAVASMITVVGLVSIIISSYLILYSERLYAMAKRWGALRPFRAEKLPDPLPRADELSDHVILLGMNALGRDLARVLHERGETVLAIDNDVRKLEGLPCRTMVGNVEFPSLLEEAGLARAKLGISALQIEETNNLFAFQCKRHGVPVAIHAFDRSVFDELRRIGVDYMIDSKSQGGTEVATRLYERGVVGP